MKWKSGSNTFSFYLNGLCFVEHSLNEMESWTAFVKLGLGYCVTICNNIKN